MRQTTPLNDGASEQVYLSLLEDIMAHGIKRQDRTGVGTLALHGATLRYGLGDGTIPMLTTRRIHFRSIVCELLWFLSGSTNIGPLLSRGVGIWSEWPHKAYVEATGDKIDLKDFEKRIIDDDDFAAKWGELGPVYGKQWRAWEGPDGRRYDQMTTLVESIRSNPDSRRLIVSGWNVAELDSMALPPCHLLYQYFVADGRLSCTLYQRSCDMGLGVPFNVVSASLLLRMLAQQCDLEAGELFWVGHDVHLYLNQLEAIQELVARQPKGAPALELTRRPRSLFDYLPSDFRLSKYLPMAPIAMPIAV